MSNGILEVTFPSGIMFEMLHIPPGSFMMGSDEKYAYTDENPVHRVNIHYSFFMSKFPVTQALWLAVMDGENPSYFKGMNRPVEQVSWFDAAVFCNRLSELCEMPTVYFSDKQFKKPFGKNGNEYILPNEGEVFINTQSKGFRLPNEAEWEYSAKGVPGTDKSLKSDAKKYLKYAGSNKLDDIGWYDENSHNETKPVVMKMPNSLGLHDMSGNVWEWCNDDWHVDYKGAPDDGSAWLEKGGGPRVFRGGSWSHDPWNCRVAHRFINPPADRDYYTGFRLVLVSLPV